MADNLKLFRKVEEWYQVWYTYEIDKSVYDKLKTTADIENFIYDNFKKAPDWFCCYGVWDMKTYKIEEKYYLSFKVGTNSD